MSTEGLSTEGLSSVEPTGFDDVDVFARFDAGAGAREKVDLYNTFRRLRERAPLVESTLTTELGVDPSIWVTPAHTGYEGLNAPTFLAVGYDAVHTVLRDQENFGQLAQVRAYRHTIGDVLTALESDAHRSERSLVSQAFSRRAIENWGDEVIAPVAAGLVAEIGAGDTAELMSQFAFPFSARVIAGVLGLPTSQSDRMLNLALACVALAEPELAEWGKTGMTRWADEVIAARRADPSNDGHDVISMLVRAEQDGESLTGEQITTFVRFLYPAGFETTYRAMSNTIVALLSTGQWDVLRADRSLLGNAVAEGLRWQTSLIGHPRVARSDVEVDGVHVPEGAVVLAFHAAANRDPSRWEDPDRFDITRPIKLNATFGFGAHLCLGKPLAEAEIKRALDVLLDAFPDLHLDPDADPADRVVNGVAFRSPAGVQVRLR
ncbi:cytochrome P450 [Pseudonocardia xishanensis]|uniref:Cytochrome P450 n=1 Tax=Pseudonocardia xishanensis TaxID=630995 RepID=A0ABP8RZG8_9PSEU